MGDFGNIVYGRKYFVIPRSRSKQSRTKKYGINNSELPAVEDEIKWAESQR